MSLNPLLLMCSRVCGLAGNKKLIDISDDECFNRASSCSCSDSRVRHMASALANNGGARSQQGSCYTATVELGCTIECRQQSRDSVLPSRRVQRTLVVVWGPQRTSRSETALGCTMREAGRECFTSFTCLHTPFSTDTNFTSRRHCRRSCTTLVEAYN
jgi:hypothetical protein